MVAYFLEAGLVLIVVPWSAFWDRNLFLHFLPTVGDVLTNNYVRGAVSGLGVVTMVAGFAELAGLMAGRRRTPGLGVNPFARNRTQTDGP